MKLKALFQDEDFELGEVAEVAIATMPDGRIKARAVAKAGGDHTFCYDSLKTFANDWTDYEEPKIKKYWWVSPLDCGVVEDDLKWNESEYDDEIDKFNVEIGNYFETKEEAEKVVEKLKAFKRLKDKGFRFDGYDSGHNSNKELCGQAYFKAGNFWFDIKTDLDLLFGGKE